MSLDTLLAKSIPELKERFVDRARPVPKGLVEALESDGRQGAHHLAKQIRERWRKNRAEGQRLHNLVRFEIDLWHQGLNLIAGVDEASIAAASIIAKTTRDALMAEFDSVHPGYNCATHKGYPTPEHCRLLKELGAAPIHRRSFARVREVLGLDPIQNELFGEKAEAAGAAK